MKNIFLFAVLLFSPFITFAAGSQTYSTPGTHTFTVPNYTGTLTVEVWGGGQYPVAFAPFMGETHGTAGGDSGFNVSISSSCQDGGWLRGQACSSSLSGGVIATGGRMTPNDPVTPGTGSGGDINMTGNPPIQAEPGYVGIGGKAPFGGIGGFSPDPTTNPSGAGQQPGGGGGNIGCAKFICWDRGGASGGYSKKTYTAGALAAGTAVTVVVGAGGNEEPSSKGGDGMVKIVWTDAAAAPATSAPACGAVTNPTTQSTGTSGSQTFSSVGNYSFNVPQYNGTLTVEVWGGGQYPVAFAPFMGETHGTAGDASSFNNTVIAGGGHMTPSDPVVGGIASGGDININGAPPIQAEPGYVGIGGKAPFGGIGGFYPDPTSNPSAFGQQPGGGGGNIGCAKFICWDRGGASGGYTKKTYAPGQISGSVPVVVGAGGSEGGSKLGADGMVKVTWTATGQTLSLCSAGYTLQNGKCVAQGCPVCPAGQTRNEQGQCVPNTSCPAGYHFDLLTNQCVINGPTVCIAGYHLDTATNQCVPDTDIVIIGTPRIVGWGTTSVIKWSAVGAASCVGTGFDTGGATSGTYTTDPLLQTTTFTLVCDTGTKTVTIEVPSCPVGYVGTPPVCTLASGTCPVGYTGTPPNCSVAASCPLNYTGTPPNCIPNSCNPSNICNGNNIVNSCTGAVIQSCAYSCANGACIVPPPSVVSWNVAPLIVNLGFTTNVSWEVRNVSSCTVSGTNGDSWTGLTGTKVSGPINSQTVFTLNCAALLGSNAANVTRTATVNIVPVFQEK